MRTERRPGRDGAVEALVAAGRELFVEHGPSAVSLRDVAKRAGVNHGLIHHYIGGREDLLRLVFATSTEHARAEIASATDPVHAVRQLRELGGTNDEYTRLLAWALLEGRDPADFHGRSAALDTVANGSRELRVALAVAMVETLGWKLFGRYAVEAAGLGGDDVDTVRERAETMVDRLIAEAS